MGTQPPPDVIAAARAAQARHGIPASISLAQWALESGWGRRLPAGSNNPFGIKARRGEPSVVALTREVIKGRSVTVQQAFRAFASLAEAFEAHARLLATAGVYRTARAVLPDPFAFAERLGGGTPEHPNYSTDPGYGRALAAVIRGSNLTRFDR